MFVRCPFCHRWVLRWLYARHEKKHTELRSDGQMAEHVTAPPEARFSGPLDGVPRGYRHSACGVVTGMPEEIVRTYLVRPMTYGDDSFCCGCGTYVDSAQLVWQETGESVMDYMGRLRLGYLRSALGMRLPDRPAGVVLTPRAARKVREIFCIAGVSPGCLVIVPDDGGSANFQLDVADSPDEATQAVFEASGVTLAVAKRHARRLSGLAIDHLESPQTGFCVVRLYAPADW